VREQLVVIDDMSVDGPAVIKRIGRRIVWCHYAFGGWVVPLPLMIGRLQQQVHSTVAGMAVVSIVFVLSALCVLFAGRRMARR